jgi:hypothetical protein
MTTMYPQDPGAWPNDGLRAALERSASAFKAASVPFALASLGQNEVHNQIKSAVRLRPARR